MTIQPHEVIWHPDVYGGRQDPQYTQVVDDVSLAELTRLVQERADQDGQWAIDQGLVGDNEDKMRRMMEFVSKETNIQQCVGHILKEEMQTVRTVDWVCRELANASKYAVK